MAKFSIIWCRLLLLACAAVLPSSLNAQLPTSDLTRIVPRAARAGETVQVDLVGKNLDELSELRFTHPGITAKPVLPPASEFFPEPRSSGSQFTVTVANDVPAGIYEARAAGYFGLSTARPFVVAATDSNEVACDGKNTSQETAFPVAMNSVVTGDIPGRGMHWFRINAKAGQRVLLEVLAERIDSRLDSQLMVFGAQGQELDRNRDKFGRDSFLEVQPKQDGEFLVAVSDILYRGGNEYFYRLSISDGPHVDFIFPPAGEPGSTGEYTLYGRNLPGSIPDPSLQIDGKTLEALQVDISLPGERATPAVFHPAQPRQGLLPGFNYQFPNANAVRLGFATGKVVIESSADSVQKVTLPCEVAGRFNGVDDEDTFRFTAQIDTTYGVEVIADRMDSPVDAFIVVDKVTVSDDGTETLTQVAVNDEMPSFFSIDGKDSINADTTDAAVSFQSDHGGDYQVTIVNQFGDGGAGHLYRLAIRPQTPDFQLIATTERPLPTNRTGYSVTPHLRQGAKWGIRIICPRQDDFEGDIVITAENLPPGVSARPLVLSGKTDHGILVVSADAEAKSWAGEIRIIGRTEAGGTPLVREARFASLVWGHIFADSIRVRSRLTERIPLSVNQYEQAPVIIRPAEDKVWTVEVGQKLELPIEVTDNGTRVGNLTIEPQGLFGLLRSPPTVNIAEKEHAATLTISFAPNGNFTVEPGRYQFTLQGTGVTRYSPNVAAKVRSTEQQQRIEDLVVKITAEAEVTKSAALEARKLWDEAKQKVATAAADKDAKAVLKIEADKLKVSFETADKAAKSDAERLRAVQKARTEVVNAAKSAAAKSKEKNTNFAAWSDLITVIVTPKAK